MRWGGAVARWRRVLGEEMSGCMRGSHRHGRSFQKVPGARVHGSGHRVRVRVHLREVGAGRGVSSLSARPASGRVAISEGSSGSVKLPCRLVTSGFLTFAFQHF